MIGMALHLFGYDLRAFLRNRQSQFFTLALPVLFLVIFASVFGGGGSTTQVAGSRAGWRTRERFSLSGTSPTRCSSPTTRIPRGWGSPARICWSWPLGEPRASSSPSASSAGCRWDASRHSHSPTVTGGRPWPRESRRGPDDAPHAGQLRQRARFPKSDSPSLSTPSGGPSPSAVRSCARNAGQPSTQTEPGRSPRHPSQRRWVEGGLPGRFTGQRGETTVRSGSKSSSRSTGGLSSRGDENVSGG